MTYIIAMLRGLASVPPSLAIVVATVIPVVLLSVLPVLLQSLPSVPTPMFPLAIARPRHKVFSGVEVTWVGDS